MANETRTATGMALLYLRELLGLTQQEVADRVGISRKLIGNYERGTDKLSRENLDEIAGQLGQPPEAVDVLLFVHELLVPETPDEPASPVALTPEERSRLHRTVITFGWTLVPQLQAALLRQKKQEKAEAAQREAEELWALFKTAPRKDRRELVRIFPEYRCWALAVRVCEASLRAASHRAGEALELAELALFIAERVPDEESFRLRLQGFCGLHIGNARRVANDFAGADHAFTTADELWQAGADPEGLLPEWLRFALEAALRREQHEFDRALELLDQAMGAHGADKSAGAKILLERERVFDQMGDFDGALRVLIETAPLVAIAQEPHLLLSLRFKTARTLCLLERYKEAAELLPEIRLLAGEQRNELNFLRLGWLEAKIMAGLGQKNDAMLRLEQVQKDFTQRSLPYDAALSTLDLAVLCLDTGRTAEVRELALGMQWIFTAQGIEREALAALKLFCEAAKQEVATGELARRVIADIEKVRRSATRS